MLANLKKKFLYELDLEMRLKFAVHNLVAHPLCVLLPRTWGGWLHDKTSPEEIGHDQSMGASECIRECHVPMGNHHGHRCPCGLWVWGGPTVCQRCVDAEAVKAALLRADTAAKVAVEWEKLFNEQFFGFVKRISDTAQKFELADRVGAVKLLLGANGCDCDCGHDAESHGSDCDRCLACRISWAIET